MKKLQFILIILSVAILIYPKDGFPLPFLVKWVAFLFIMYAILKLLKKLSSKHEKDEKNI